MYANLISGPLDGEVTIFDKPVLDPETNEPTIISRPYNKNAKGGLRANYVFTRMIADDIAEFTFVRRSLNGTRRPYDLPWRNAK